MKKLPPNVWSRLFLAPRPLSSPRSCGVSRRPKRCHVGELRAGHFVGAVACGHEAGDLPLRWRRRKTWGAGWKALGSAFGARSGCWLGLGGSLGGTKTWCLLCLEPVDFANCKQLHNVVGVLDGSQVQPARPWVQKWCSRTVVWPCPC